GGSYDAGRLRISADVARTDSKFTGSTESVDRTVVGGQTIDFDVATPQFNIRNFDAANPANYRFDGFYEEAQISKGDDWQARLDAEYETQLSFLPRVMAGIRYTNRDAHREFGNRFAGYRPQNLPLSAVPLDFELFRPGFRGTDIQPFRTFLAPTYQSIRDNRVAMRQFVISHPASFGFPNDGHAFTVNDPAPNPTDTYDATEETLAGYVQVDYKIGEAIDGVIGLRAVKTSSDITGTSLVAQADPDGGGPLPAPPSIFTPVSVGQSYTDWLPNVSLRWHITPEVQLRLSATETRTRPTFGQLNPSASLGAPPGSCNPSGDPFACARRGGGGNPFLQPFTSRNYDASLEYYFSRTGFVSVAAFRRDLKGFIQNQELRYIDPTLGPLIVNGPVNTGKGRIDGFEAQISTFFDFEFLPDWARSFGAQANVTYLDAKTGFPTGGGDFQLDRILGVAKWTYNLVGMYENGGVSARLSYNKRGSSIETRQLRGNQADPNDFGNDFYFERAEPAGRLDLSTSYALTDKFTVFFDWTNILENPFKQVLSSARQGKARSEYIRFLRFEETTYSLGVRFRF
ncbi:MAG: TonB-dependent receptor, partial [Allosphingosinicella sp.]